MARAKRPPVTEDPPLDEPNDIDPTTGATVGRSAEPQAVTEEPAAPAPATPAGPPAEAEPTEPVPWQDTKRNAIAARRRERVEAEVAEGASDPQVAMLRAQAGDVGEGAEPAPAVPAVTPATPAPAQDDAAAALASGAQSITIKVDGKEHQVQRTVLLALGEVLMGKDAPEQDRLTAGLRELQMSKAAADRLRQAATTQAQLDQREEALTAREAALRRAPQVSAPPPPLPAAPSPGVPKLDPKKFVSDFYSGDRTVAESAVSALLDGVARQVAPPPAVNVSAAVQQEFDRREAAKAEATLEREQAAANAVFETELTDLKTPAWMSFIRTQADELAQDPTWQGCSLAERVREAGRIARGGSGAPAPATPAPAPAPGETLEDRERRKAAMPTVVTASARRVAPAPPAPKTPSGVVAGMKKARGQA